MTRSRVVFSSPSLKKRLLSRPATLGAFGGAIGYTAPKQDVYSDVTVSTNQQPQIGLRRLGGLSQGQRIMNQGQPASAFDAAAAQAPAQAAPAALGGYGRHRA